MDTVLIVDDSLTVRMDLSEAFEAAGFRVLLCETVAQARQVLAKEPVSLAVLDVLLPDGDGIELLREIRGTPAIAKAPVMMLSTEAEVIHRSRGIGTGADDYVGKPYDTGYVVARAKELLGNRQEPPGQGGPTAVLVIDDSQTFREALRESLTAAGYAVLLAASGEEGLHSAASNRPAAIVVDSVMPGIDGGTVVRRIRLDAALRNTPCLLLTAAGDRDSELRALEAGADAFVRKEEEIEVILARLRAILRKSEARSGRAPSLLGPKRILAVDDSMTYLQELAAALRGEGYDVMLAGSGVEALELLAIQTVDCILLDVMMPGLSGQETCARIKETPMTRDIPLIMITALEDRAAMIEGLGNGADDYISKTNPLDVVVARVRAQLRRKQFEDENRKFREELLRGQIEASEAQAIRQVAEARAAMVAELERKNNELEAFTYAVSHDLRAPLRSISGFSNALLEDCAGLLDEQGRKHLDRILGATRRMSELIDGLLELSRSTRGELRRSPVNLSTTARALLEDMQRKDPERTVTLEIHDALTVDADGRLMQVLLENLLGNAWKFTSRTDGAKISLEAEERDGATVYIVRDNGAGFDMAHAEKLFAPFQRLHTTTEFPGTGIGLATVQRIVGRHGGRVWAESAPGQGAAIYFTLPPGIAHHA